MSDTPRSDAAKFSCDYNHVVPYHVACELEREVAKLHKDTARLNWFNSIPGRMWWVTTSIVYSTSEGFRAAIDAAIEDEATQHRMEAGHA